MNHDMDHFFLDENTPQFEDDRWVDFVGYRIHSNKSTLLIVSSFITTGYAIGGSSTTRFSQKCSAWLKFTPTTGKTYRLFYEGGVNGDEKCSVNIKEVVQRNENESLNPVDNVVFEKFQCT